MSGCLTWSVPPTVWAIDDWAVTLTVFGVELQDRKSVWERVRTPPRLEVGLRLTGPATGLHVNITTSEVLPGALKARMMDVMMVPEEFLHVTLGVG